MLSTDVEEMIGAGHKVHQEMAVYVHIQLPLITNSFKIIHPQLLLHCINY